MGGPGQRTIVIVGAGFSGTALAAQLLRQGPPVRVVLVNRYGPMGRGVAYGTAIESHLLNVHAGGMSAFPEEPAHFVRWARGREPAVTDASFVSRRFYGEYLESVLAEAERAGAPDALLERRVGRAADVEPRQSGAEVVFGDGTRLFGDRVVLALGNYSPANLPVEDGGLYASRRYVRDPWVPKALAVVESGESVLLIGTGLTMMDIAIDLAGRTGGGRLTALSRHGLLPQPHRPGTPSAALEPPPALQKRPARIAEIVRAFRAAAAHRQRNGGDWREVVASIRAITPELWKALPTEERARFLRHVRPYWEIHRHRAAPETAAAVASLEREGILGVRAARILSMRDGLDEADVEIRDRRSGRVETLHVSRVVNCTGPDSDVRRVRDPFLDAMLGKGLIAPDPLRIGLAAAETGALLDESGRPSPALFLLGPLLRGRDWECTAVPELRAHAARLASTLLS